MLRKCQRCKRQRRSSRLSAGVCLDTVTCHKLSHIPADPVSEGQRASCECGQHWRAERVYETVGATEGELVYDERLVWVDVLDEA